MPLASAVLSLEWLESTLLSYVNDTTTLLQIAPWSAYHTASLAAVQDTVAAITSCWTLLQLIWTPVLLGLYYIVTVTADNLYRHILTHVFSRSLAQLKQVAAAYYQWQCSLTPQQTAVELAALLLCVALYQLRRYIQQQAITQRVMNFYRRQQSQVQKVSFCTGMKVAFTMVDRCIGSELFSCIMLLFRRCLFLLCIRVRVRDIWLAKNRYILRESDLDVPKRVFRLSRNPTIIQAMDGIAGTAVLLVCCVL
jgi:hypothetical protein